MSEFMSLTTIEESCEILDSKRKPIKKGDRRQGQYAYYGASGIADFIDEYVYEGTHLLLSEDGDNLKTRKTPIAFLAQGKFWVNNHAHVLKGKNGNLTEYICYALQIADINSFISGSTRPKITQSDMRKIQFYLPPIPQQKAIAHILGKLDDKIELNRQMNQTLEAMAQALFKSWFVDFDPVMDNALAAGNPIPEGLQAKAEKRKAVPDDKKLLFTNPELAKKFPNSFTYNEPLGKWIPAGWDSEKLGEKLAIRRGGSPRPIKDFIVDEGYPWLKIADATAEKSPFIFGTREFIKEEGLRKTVYLDKGELILSNSATPGLPKFLNIKSCIHDGWLYFPKKEHFTDEYLYFLFLKLRETFIMKGNGSVFTNLKTDILRDQDVIIPPVEIVNKFTQMAKSSLNRLKASRLEIETLTQLRDTLLPQLISGKVRVQEGLIEKEIA